MKYCVALAKAWLVAAVLLAAPAVHAQEAPDTSRDLEARALFDAGVAAFNAGRYQDALARFETAYELSGHPQLLYNIGQAADRLRDDEAALRYFRLYLSESPRPERRSEVEARIAAIERVRSARRPNAAHVTEAPNVERAATTPASPVASDRGFDLSTEWWFWSLVGVVVVGGAVAVGVAATTDTSPRLVSGDVGEVIFTLRGALP